MPWHLLSRQSLRLDRATLVVASLTCGLLACLVPYGEDEAQVVAQWLPAETSEIWVFERAVERLDTIAGLLVGFDIGPESIEDNGVDLTQPLIVAFLDEAQTIAVVSGHTSSAAPCESQPSAANAPELKWRCVHHGERVLWWIGNEWTEDEAWRHHMDTLDGDEVTMTLRDLPWFRATSEQLTAWPVRGFFSQSALLHRFEVDQRFRTWLLGDLLGLGVGLDYDDHTIEVTVIEEEQSAWLPRLIEVDTPMADSGYIEGGGTLNGKLETDGLLSMLRQRALDSLEADTLLTLASGLSEATGQDGAEALFEVLSGEFILTGSELTLSLRDELNPEIARAGFRRWCERRAGCTSKVDADTVDVTLPDGAQLSISFMPHAMKLSWGTQSATKSEGVVPSESTPGPLGQLFFTLEGKGNGAHETIRLALTFGVQRIDEAITLSAAEVDWAGDPILMLSGSGGPSSRAVPVEMIQTRLEALADVIDLWAVLHGLPETLDTLLTGDAIAKSELMGDGGEAILYRSPAIHHRHRRYDLCARGPDREPWTADDICLH